MTSKPTDNQTISDSIKPRRKHRVIYLFLFLFFLLVFYLSVGFFVVQPIGAIPDGVTVLYWRFGTNMPFISSADGILLKDDQGVTLIGRAVVIGKVGELLENRKIVSMPYSRTLYLLSTGGREFEN